jgi:hypothetical protein
VYWDVRFENGYVIVDADSEATIAFLRGLGVPPTWTIQTTRGRRLYLSVPEAIETTSEDAGDQISSPVVPGGANLGRERPTLPRWWHDGVLCEVVDRRPVATAPAWLARWATWNDTPNP